MSWLVNDDDKFEIPDDTGFGPPPVKPAQARKTKIVENLSTQTGWTFVEYLRFENPKHCELSGLSFTKGVKIGNEDLEKEVVCGIGIAKKYTDAKLPDEDTWFAEQEMDEEDFEGAITWESFLDRLSQDELSLVQRRVKDRRSLDSEKLE